MDREHVAFYVLTGMAVMFAVTETLGIGRMAYSKFRNDGRGMSTRAGMVLIYALPIAVYVGLWLQAGAPRTPYHLALLAAFVGHFAKRVAESLWLHHYSRPTPILSFANIAFAYGAGAAVAGWFQNRASPRPFDLLFALGAALCLAGEAINFAHHLLLARLRGDGDSQYKLPRGGLFAWVACPHYLGEILAFWGLACMARVLPIWGSALLVTAYLGARSHSTLKWYRDKLEVPPGWRRLVPFVY